MLIQGDQSPSSSTAQEANRHIKFTSDGVDTESETSVPSLQESRTGVPFLDLVSAFQDQTSQGSSVSTQATMTSVQGSVGGTGTYFTRNTARTETEVLAKQVVVPKDKRGTPGSREFGIHYTKATGALDQVFGAARHFVPTSRGGETDTKYQNIQELYVGNLEKLKGVKDCITKYDMMDPFKIPALVDIDTDDPELRWGDETTKRDMLVHWSQIELLEVKAYQLDTNGYASEEDMTSSDWVKDLMMNSSEVELKGRVDEKFEKLDSLEQGGITYLKLMLDEMFCMTNDVVTALQTFLKNFAVEGLTKTEGENVSEVSAQVKAVCERLAEVLSLPLEAPTYILQGLTKCSVAKFTGPFELLLNQERVIQMSTSVTLGNSDTATLKRVKHILALANNSYHSLNTSKIWNVPSGHHAAREFKYPPKCFNCGEPHLLPDCKKPRDEGKIARNKKAHSEKGGDKGGYKGTGNNRKKWSKDGGGGGGRANDNKNHGNSGAQNGNGDVKLFGNKWMCHCKHKSCQWNTTHTSGFHTAWENNKKTFLLPSNHPYRHKTETNVEATSSDQSDSSLSSGGGNLIAATSLVGVISGGLVGDEVRRKTKDVLEHYKANATDPDLSSCMSDLMGAWGLN